jgi:cyclopropane fatty-acyl-phospholipid synthase-like methyltransferase
MSEWFKAWFDCKYYHILYKNRSDKEAEQFIIKLAKELTLSPGDLVLDLACGRGRHSVYLNKLGYKVKGVDLSEESILFAKQFETSSLNFEVHDMRESVDQSNYNAILNLFTSFGYFEQQDDNLKMLNSMKENLAEDGCLVIDFMNSAKVIQELVVAETKEVDEIIFNIKREFKNGFICKSISFTDEGETFNFDERVQALSLADFESLFDKSELEIVKTYGDYNLSEFDELTSDRLIIIAKTN